MAATFLDLNRPLPGRASGPDSSPDPAEHLFQALRLVALESSKDLARERFPHRPDGSPFENKNEQQMLAYRELPDSDLFRAAWVSVPLPPSEFPGYRGARVTCSVCGEGINFDRFTLRSGAATDTPEALCLSCADPANRYYQPLPEPPPQL